MLIAVEYKNGRIKEFDTSAFTTPQALTTLQRGMNVLTEFDLRLDRLEIDGLVLDVFWRDVSLMTDSHVLDDTATARGGEVKIKHAKRRAAFSIELVNPSVLERVSRILVTRANGTVQAAWRQGSGNWLIKGSMFDAQRVLNYSDATTTSMNAQVSRVFSYIRKTSPLMDDEQIARSMGFPLPAIQEIQGQEAEQDDPSGNASELAGLGADGVSAASGDGGGDGGLVGYADLVGPDPFAAEEPDENRMAALAAMSGADAFEEEDEGE